jgi:tight adherence protein B
VLGFALGVDPLDVVLHTVPGGVCAALAMALQVAGTAWTERLGRSAVAA